jgi:hypothetical protein
MTWRGGSVEGEGEEGGLEGGKQQHRLVRSALHPDMLHAQEESHSKPAQLTPLFVFHVSHL